MRTVNGKDLESLNIHPTNPARDATRLTIPIIDQWISIRSKSSLPSGKLFQFPEREPRVITDLPFSSHRRQEVSHDRHRQEDTDNAVKKYSQSHKSCASRDSVFYAHGRSP